MRLLINETLFGGGGEANVVTVAQAIRCCFCASTHSSTGCDFKPRIYSTISLFMALALCLLDRHTTVIKYDIAWSRSYRGCIAASGTMIYYNIHIWDRKLLWVRMVSQMLQQTKICNRYYICRTFLGPSLSTFDANRVSEKVKIIQFTIFQKVF
jgi:hypothetical protein